jgi:hypothetical protein
MTFIVSPHFIEVLGNQDRDMEMPKKNFFLEGLEKVGKTFFQSIGVKKSKIVNKISSKLEVFEEGGSKISFSCKIAFKIQLF